MRQAFWLAVQVPFVAGAVWLWSDSPDPQKPSLGVVVLLGIGAAWLVTALISFFVEMVGFLRRDGLKPRRVDPVGLQPLDHLGARNTGLKRLLRL